MNVLWCFRWKYEDEPIIEGSAETLDRECRDVIVAKSLVLLIKAKDYKGIPYSDVPTPPMSKRTLMVSFSILFPSYEQANNYLRFLEKLEHI